MNEDNRQLKAFPIAFQIYAHSEQEAEEARQAFITFINQHREAGRAVTAQKVAKAIANWDHNPIVRTQIINYFK